MEKKLLNRKGADTPTSAVTRRQIEWLEDLRSLGLEPCDVVEHSVLSEPSKH